MNSNDQPMGGLAAEDMNQDFIEGVDEDGNTVLLEVVRYFFYNGEEYVVLGDAQQDSGCGHDCQDCDHNHATDEEDDDEEAINLYIMKVVETQEDGEDMEEFVPVEDQDLLDKLIEIVQADFDNDLEVSEE